MESVWASLGAMILFVAVAAISLLLVIPAISGFQTSFESTICKLNAWMRASTLGNPLFQSIISGSQFLFGGFTNVVTSMSMPFICEPAPLLESKGEGVPFTISDVIDKVASESVNCWDQMGLGKWDPLVLAPQGQTFTCFEQVMEIKCTKADIESLWTDLTADGQTLINAKSSGTLTIFDQELINYYMRTHLFSYSGIPMTYADILPSSSPRIGTSYSASQFIVCDNKVHKYHVSLHFIDSFAGFKSALTIPLLCQLVDLKSVGGDTLYLCLFEYKTGG